MRDLWLIYDRIAEISAFWRKSVSRNTTVTSDFRPEVEISRFRACAVHQAIIIGTVGSLWTWLWARTYGPISSVLLFRVGLRRSVQGEQATHGQWLTQLASCAIYFGQNVREFFWWYSGGFFRGKFSVKEGGEFCAQVYFSRWNARWVCFGMYLVIFFDGVIFYGG